MKPNPRKLALSALTLAAFATTARARSLPPVVEDDPIGPPITSRSMGPVIEREVVTTPVGGPIIEREVVTTPGAVVVDRTGVRPLRARREYRREVRQAAREARRYGTTTVIPSTTVGPARAVAVTPPVTTVTETVVQPVPTTTTVITTPRSAVVAPIDPLVPASYYYPVQPRGFRLRGPFGGGMSLAY